MDSAKNAVKDLLHRAGKNDTTVHEKVAPGVTHENIERQQREEVTTAVDKEIHQDHYHTTVQPIKANEVLPEQHHHRVAAGENRQFDNRNAETTRQGLQDEAGKYRDVTTRTEGASTTSANPVVTGQHTHHHVHETIQPVVEKQTIDPHVVHTTVPVHETHHNAPQFHTTSALPAVSMSEFKANNGVLTGRDERSDAFAGEPRTVGKGIDTRAHHGVGGVPAANQPQHATGSHQHGQTQGSAVDSVGSKMQSTGLNDGTQGTQTGQKASLMDKINPRVDADGDGKKGFMN